MFIKFEFIENEVGYTFESIMDGWMDGCHECVEGVHLGVHVGKWGL